MILRAAAGVTDDDQMIAWLQGFSCDTLLVELSAAAPFDGILNGFTFFVLALDMNERMRVAEYELNQITLDRLLLIFEVGSSKGMVTVDLSTGQQGGCG